MTIEMTKSQLTDMIDGVLRERGAEALAEQINDAIERKHAEWVKMTSSEQHRATVKANLFGLRETRGKTAGDQGMAIARIPARVACVSSHRARAALPARVVRSTSGATVYADAHRSGSSTAQWIARPSRSAALSSRGTVCR